MSKNQTLLLFLFGVLIGFCLSVVVLYPKKLSFAISNNAYAKKGERIVFQSKYNEDLADKVFNDVKLLCWIMTTPENHQKKAIHVKNTWGKRCNKLLFMSSVEDVEIGSVALPIKEGRSTLWDKTKHAFKYIYDHHFDEADWFLKADDDNYMFPENIRYMLSQYRPQTAFYFGHRYATEHVEEGYMAGGGYILSKKAVEKFVTQIMMNKTICSSRDSGAEDLEMGRCLQHSTIFVDERDENNQKRFFPAGIRDHLKKKVDLTYWYDYSRYYEVAQGSLECCSDLPAGFHYVDPKEMYFIDYLVRRVHPFGLLRNNSETLPRKLKLKEILRASDQESPSIKFKKHNIIHILEESEKYVKK